MAEIVNLEERAAELIKQGRRVGFDGGRVEHPDEGSVTVHSPVARGGALLVHKERSPEVDPRFGPRCTKCRGGDVVVVVGFPGGDGDPIQICRTCVDRPVDKPLVIQFRS